MRNYRRTSDDAIDILLVEDDPEDARLIREAFAAIDRETRFETVAGGGDAVAHLTRPSPESPLPNLVLIDLHGPDRDGCVALERIKSDPNLRWLPVIVLTADDDVERWYDARANACLCKPTDLDDLSSLASSIERFWFEHASLPSGPS